MRAILEKWVPHSRWYLYSIRVSRVRVTRTVMVRISSVSVMVSVRIALNKYRCE